MPKRILALTLAAILAAAGLPTITRGMFINNSVKIPVDRVVANVEAWIKEKPQDAQAEYVLARIHSMAYAYGPQLSLWAAQGRGGVRGRGARGGGGEPEPGGGAAADPFAGQLPGFAPMDTVRVQRRDNAGAVTAADIQHLEASLKHYRRAIELDNRNALYEMGLAWMYEQAGKVARALPATFGDLPSAIPTEEEKTSYDAAIRKLGDADAKVREDATRLLAQAMPKPYAQLQALKGADPETTARVDGLLHGHWDLQALEHYRKAYALAIQADLARRGGLMTPDLYVSAESGERILEIFKSQPQAAAVNESRDIAANIQRVRDKPLAVTPVIFAMPTDAPGQPAHIGDLLDSSKRVAFDLAGDGIDRQWPWLRDGTALLVWDPALTGNITSGKQLFGSRTWWIFFRDGYEALSVLDDNRDGLLSGAETHGIAVWIDHNGDAVSQPGEVISLERAGIAAIGVSAQRGPDDVLTVQEGITFTDGRSVPSFDWVTLPVPPVTSNSRETH